MSKSGIDVAKLGIDELGRTILPDDLLDRIEACEHTLSAGANGACWNTSNTGCSNVLCNGSWNTGCSNSMNCYESMNHFCVDGPIG
jgi:hypothetical protein